MSKKLMSDLKEAFPKVKWKWKSKDENVAVGRCANGLSIEVYRPLGGYVETYASVSIDGELIFDDGLPLVDGELIDEDFLYGDADYDPSPSATDEASDVVGFAVGCALFSRLVGGGVSLQSLTSFDPWVQDSLAREIERRREWDLERLQSAKKIIGLLEPRLQKADEALTVLKRV